jgi:hypothetical protein
MDNVIVEEFFDFRGKKIVELIGFEVGSDHATLVDEAGDRYVFWYQQDCCASCSIEDICGDVDDLVDTHVISVEQISNFLNEDELKKRWEYEPESYTWTFYRFITGKGVVTVRWLGTSNGYYSESVSFRIDKKESE